MYVVGHFIAFVLLVVGMVLFAMMGLDKVGDNWGFEAFSFLSGANRVPLGAIGGLLMILAFKLEVDLNKNDSR